MMDRNVCSDVQAFYLGCDVADDDTVGIGISHVVLADNGVMIALHDVAISGSVERISYKYN